MAIVQKSIKLITIVIFALFPVFALATNGGDHGDDKEFNASELINGHIGDSHEFHIADWNGHPISFYLPVILWTDNGLTVFSSEKFHHDNSGHHVVDIDGQKFVRNNEVIYYADKYETLAEADRGAFAFSSRPLDFSITKLVFSMLLSVILLFILFTIVARSYNKNDKAPKGLAGFLEPLVLFVRDDIAIPNIGEKKYAKYMPYLLTIFFFIWINNLIGLIPFFPFSSNLTGNIYFRLVLSFITFLITSFSGNKDYWKHIFWMPDVPVLMEAHINATSTKSIISYYGANRDYWNIHKTFCINDSFIRKHYCWTYYYIKFNFFNIYI
jgi:F-type H+-transporting ATPase subunit a